MRAKLEEAILYIERNPETVKSIASFPYIRKSYGCGNGIRPAIGAISQEECGVQTEAVFSPDPAGHDVESALILVGCSFVKFLCCPGAMSLLRTVIAISDRMP